MGSGINTIEELVLLHISILQTDQIFSIQIDGLPHRHFLQNLQIKVQLINLNKIPTISSVTQRLFLEIQLLTKPLGRGLAQGIVMATNLPRDIELHRVTTIDKHHVLLVLLESFLIMIGLLLLIGGMVVNVEGLPGEL